MSVRRAHKSAGFFFGIVLLCAILRLYQVTSVAKQVATARRGECVAKCNLLLTKTRELNKLFILSSQSGTDNKVIQREFEKRHAGLVRSLSEYQRQLDELQFDDCDRDVRNVLKLLSNVDWLNDIDELCNHGCFGGDFPARLEDLAALRKLARESCNGCR